MGYLREWRTDEQMLERIRHHHLKIVKWLDKDPPAHRRQKSYGPIFLQVLQDLNYVEAARESGYSRSRVEQIFSKGFRYALHHINQWDGHTFYAEAPVPPRGSDF